MVEGSVLEEDWMEALIQSDQPTLFLAEGLFMYLPKKEVIQTVANICERVQSGQLVAEMVKDTYTRGFNKWLLGFKFKRELGFDEPLTYHCGIKDSDEVECWHPKIKLVDDWNYLNSGSDKLGFERHLLHFKKLSKVQWTARYIIGDTHV